MTTCWQIAVSLLSVPTIWFLLMSVLTSFVPEELE